MVFDAFGVNFGDLSGDAKIEQEGVDNIVSDFGVGGHFLSGGG